MKKKLEQYWCVKIIAYLNTKNKKKNWIKYKIVVLNLVLWLNLDANYLEKQSIFVTIFNIWPINIRPVK